MSDSTALTAPAGLPNHLGRIPTDDEIEHLRKAGAQLVAHKAALKELEDQIAGMEWGSGNYVTKGSSLSPQTRAALAEFCRITRANPIYHLDLMGSKPYLNANYWTDLANSEPRFHHYEQRDLSPSVEEALRDRAKRHRAAAEELRAAGATQEAAQRVTRALDLEDEADDIALARAQWSPRPTATAVVETTVYRFIHSAPIEAIRRGDITEIDQYIVPVVECNWAGGMGNNMASSKKWDPIGDANPGTTARTRSLRRALVKSLPAWMERHDAQIRKAEEIVEAEWSVIVDDEDRRRASLPGPTGPQGVSTAAGEPTAANARGAAHLPVEGEPTKRRPEPAPAQGDAGAPDPESWDPTAARRRLFATLKDVGINEGVRKEWAGKHDLPRSTQHWTRDEFERAFNILEETRAELIAEIEPKVRDGLEILGDDLGDVALQVLGKAAPEYLADWQQLHAELQARADA